MLNDFLQMLSIFILAISVYLIAIFFGGCGTVEKEVISPEIKVSFDQVKPIIDEYCGTCHNGIKHPLKFDTQEKWAGSSAKLRISNRTMPPNGGDLPQDKREMLLSSF